jgi:hypothetical protein
MGGREKKGGRRREGEGGTNRREPRGERGREGERERGRKGGERGEREREREGEDEREGEKLRQREEGREGGREEGRRDDFYAHFNICSGHGSDIIILRLFIYSGVFSPRTNPAGPELRIKNENFYPKKKIRPAPLSILYFLASAAVEAQREKAWTFFLGGLFI